MLTMKPLDWRYLSRQVAYGDGVKPADGKPGMGEYLSRAGHAPGRWFGDAEVLATLRLRPGEEASERQLESVYGGGRNPATGEQLGRRYSVFRSSAEERASARVAGEPGERAAARIARAGGAGEMHAERAAEILAEETALTFETALSYERMKERHARQGWDLTLSPVKSLSLVHALVPDARELVERGVREVRDEVLAEVADQVVTARVTVDGEMRSLPARMVGASFEHHDTRCGDPDFHIHVAVFARVFVPEKQAWYSLDARELHAAQVAFSETVDTRLEDWFRQHAGMRFADRPDTVGRDRGKVVREVVGVPAGLVPEFSARSRQVHVALNGGVDEQGRQHPGLMAGFRAEHGREPNAEEMYRLADAASLIGRPPKDPRDVRIPLSELLERWRQQAVDTVGVETVDGMGERVLGRAAPTLTAADVDVDALAGRVVGAVQARRATWTQWNLRAEVERLSRPLPLAGGERGLLVEAVQARATELSVQLGEAGRRFSSPALIDAERSVLDGAKSSTGRAVPAEAVDAALERLAAAGMVLGADQEAAVRALCASTAEVRALVAPAGSGKTTAMRAVVAAHEEAGLPRPLGLAQSSAAAKVLGDETGLPAENITKYRYEAEAGPYTREWRLQPGQLVIVDEASLAGTLDAAALLEHAKVAGGSVLVVGDPAQLSSPAAGGLLRLLHKEGAAVELEQVRRFAQPWEGPASLKLRDGETSAIAVYAAHGRLHGGSREQMLQAAYNGWRRDTLDGKRSLLVAPDNANVAALNGRARADRVAAGQVEPDGVRLRDGNPAGAGDVIVARRNDRSRRLGGPADYLRNGTALEVVRILADGGLDVRHPDTGIELSLAKHYVVRSVELGYAATVHRAEGITCDTAHALLDTGTSRQAGYVAATRGSDRNSVYVVTDRTGDLDAGHELGGGLARDPGQPMTPEEAWAVVLQRDGAEQSATEVALARQPQMQIDGPGVGL